MTVWIKQGVMGDLKPVARKGFGRVAKLFKSAGYDTFLTSKGEANHSEGSLHYEGLAFDIQPNPQFGVKEILEVLGKGWQVINEGNHIHCEFDPV